MEESECQELIRLSDNRVLELEKVVLEIPECPVHGSMCLSHAREWVRRVKTFGEIIIGGKE